MKRIPFDSKGSDQIREVSLARTGFCWPPALWPLSKSVHLPDREHCNDRDTVLQCRRDCVRVAGCSTAQAAPCRGREDLLQHKDTGQSLYPADVELALVRHVLHPAKMMPPPSLTGGMLQRYGPPPPQPMGLHSGDLGLGVRVDVSHQVSAISALRGS